MSVKSTKTNKGGRKSSYDTHILPSLVIIEQYAREGFIEKDIAKKIGIGYSTFNKYKASKVEFAEALKKSEAYCNSQIEAALFNKALSGDTLAMIFWTKNRMPERWKDKQDMAFSGGLNMHNTPDIAALKDMTVEQLRALAGHTDNASKHSDKIIDITPSTDSELNTVIMPDNCQ